jgi:hypothetical protein
VSAARAVMRIGMVERPTMRLMLLFAAREWHAWIAIPLFAGSIALVLAMVVGYLVKVVAPRYPRR